MAVNIITPRRREDFFDRTGEPTLRFVKWIELVTGQTNTSTIEIESSAVSGIYSLNAGDDKSDIKRTITVNSDHTALVGDFVNAKSNATVKFPKYPTSKAVVIIRNGDGSRIKLNGNGKNMNGESSGTLSRKGTSIEFYYFIDSDEWFAR